MFGVEADYSSKMPDDIETSTSYNSRMHKYTLERCELWFKAINVMETKILHNFMSNYFYHLYKYKPFRVLFL